MLFSPQALCAPVYLRELDSSGGACLLDPAPLVVVLASSGRCALVPHSSAQSPLIGLSAGELAVCSGSVTVTPATDCHVLCAGLAGLAVEQAAASLPGPVHSDGRSCPLAAQELAALASAGGTEAGAEQLAVLAFRVLCSVARADEAGSGAAMPELVTQAVLAIRRNFAGLYGVEELSAQLGVSKSHLVRVFSASMGVPPGQYLTNVRLEAAKALLANRSDSLEMVASLCGFSGANYFCKVFKKHTGMTPAAWRAANTGRSGHAGPLEQLERAMYV